MDFKSGKQTTIGVSCRTGNAKKKGNADPNMAKDILIKEIKWINKH